MTLGTLTDIISYMLDLRLDEKQALLAEVDVPHRARILLRRLEAMADDEPGRNGALPSPLQFSSN